MIDNDAYAAPLSEPEATARIPRRVYRRTITAGFTAFCCCFTLSAGAGSIGWYVLTGIYGKPSVAIEEAIRLSLLAVCVLLALASGVATGRGRFREETGADTNDIAADIMAAAGRARRRVQAD